MTVAFYNVKIIEKILKFHNVVKDVFDQFTTTIFLVFQRIL